ncbi:MAG TPA: hypothetical protein VK986_04290, partial [Tepidisphaeraceae bacterium]|nr:hypothetical protein [Tepidisphaeraceae bacterium]
MLTPAQVIPFLTHEQSAVRDMAVRYLSGAHDPAPATADDFWRAADALGFDTYEGREMALSASDLPQTDYSVDRMLGAIDGADGNDRGAELFRLRLLVELRDLPYEPLARHGERILACRRLTEAARTHLRARLAPVTDSLDALWER